MPFPNIPVSEYQCDGVCSCSVGALLSHGLNLVAGAMCDRSVNFIQRPQTVLHCSDCYAKLRYQNEVAALCSGPGSPGSKEGDIH